MRILRRIAWNVIGIFIPLLVWAAKVGPHITDPGGSAEAGTGTGRNAMMANSPFSVYTAGAVIYVLITIVLFLALIVGAFLVVNLGMMSRRERDERFKVTPEPSDLGILKGERFGVVKDERPKLPAEEEPVKPKPKKTPPQAA